MFPRFSRKTVSVAILLQSLNAFSLVLLENLEDDSDLTKYKTAELIPELLAALGEPGNPMVEREFESQRNLER